MESDAQSKRPVRILHLEDDADDRFLIARTLKAEGLVCEFVEARSRPEFEEALQRHHYDLILSDYTLPGYSGMLALQAAQEKHPLTPFIFLSGTIGEEAAVESLQRGAVDYLLKDNPRRLVPAVKRALHEAAEQAERRRQQEQLREQAALLDLAQDAIVVTEMGGIVRYWSLGAERLHGWTKSEVLGRSTKDFLYPELSWFTDAVNILQQEGEWSGDVCKRTKSGGELLMHTHWTLVRDSSGKPESVLSISTDITAQKKLEEQFLRAQRMESIGALAGGIAHDLNNIFSPILMAAEMLAGQLKEEDRKVALSILTSAQGRVCDINMRLLDNNDQPQTVLHFSHTLNAAGDRIVTEDDPKIRGTVHDGRVTEAMHDPATGEWRAAFQATRPGSADVTECQWVRSGDHLTISRRDVTVTQNGDNILYSDIVLRRKGA